MFQEEPQVVLPGSLVLFLASQIAERVEGDEQGDIMLQVLRLRKCR
jgi:hypothetical protein